MRISESFRLCAAIRSAFNQDVAVRNIVATVDRKWWQTRAADEVVADDDGSGGVTDADGLAHRRLVAAVDDGVVSDAAVAAGSQFDASVPGIEDLAAGDVAFAAADEFDGGAGFCAARTQTLGHKVVQRDVAAVFDALTSEIETSLSKGGPGQFAIPGLCKIVLKDVPAKPKRKGRNPADGSEIWLKPKPASKKLSIRPLKGLKEMI